MKRLIKIITIIYFLYFVLLTNQCPAQWIKQNTGINAAIVSIYFTDSLHGWGAEQMYTVIKTTNGGKSWVEEKNLTPYFLTSVFFTDTGHGWVVGGYIGDSISAEIFKYEKGKWTNQLNEPNAANLTSVYFTDTNHGWAVGPDEIWKYNGKEWKLQETNIYSDLESVFMIDSVTGWIAGDGTILKYDGKQWNEQYSNYLSGFNSICFTDSLDGWVVGGPLLKYKNKQWTKQPLDVNGALWSIYFTDTLNGWIVGDFGRILKFDGKVWKVQNSGTNSGLNSVYFTDKSHGWIGGRDGTILYTNNGGYTLYTDSGKVTYDNILNSPIKNSKIYGIDSEGIVKDSAITDSIGIYKLQKLTDGNYTIKIVPSEPWGGVEPTDALLVNRYYIGVYKFKDGLKKRAADVNVDGKINPLDALLINRRYIKSINSFKAGDWILDNNIIKIDSINLNNNIKVICTGDVNGSYVP